MHIYNVLKPENAKIVKNGNKWKIKVSVFYFQMYEKDLVLGKYWTGLPENN